MTWPWAGPVSPQWWHMLSPAPCTSYRFADLPQPIHLGGFEGGCCAMRAHQKQINNMSNIILSVCVRQVLSGWVGCCILLCCAVLCCAVLCCALLCTAVHCCAVLCTAVLCTAVLGAATVLSSRQSLELPGCFKQCSWASYACIVCP
jgi:hypothetical protein